ncbi:MAG: NnrU family protein, partial [Pseudomonadota bacterium]
FSSPEWLKHILWLLMIPAMILLVASQLPAGRIKKATKNPQLIGVKIWAFGHLLVNGDLASLLLFASFLAWAVLLVINTNRRGQTFPEATSVQADIISVLAGIGLWVFFMLWLHEWLIGVPAIAY